MHVPTFQNLLRGGLNGAVQMQSQYAINERQLDAMQRPNMQKMCNGQQVRHQLQEKDGRLEPRRAQQVLLFERFHAAVEFARQVFVVGRVVCR